jgi:hypothetical protein
MITLGFLERVSGKDEQMNVRIRRSLDERFGDLTP